MARSTPHKEEIINKLNIAIEDNFNLKKTFLKNEKIIIKIIDKIYSCLKNGNKILICGNGGSAADAQHLSDDRIFAFDSFEGFPKENSNHDPSYYAKKWNFKLMDIDLVTKNLKNNNISQKKLNNIIFKKGFFPDSFNGFNEKISFLHLDVDLYNSYKNCLDFFYPLLVNGGIINLAQDTSTITACGNDIGFDEIFKRNFEAFSKKGDILIAISTSGNSRNILKVLKESYKKKIYSISLLGNDGGKAKKNSNLCLILPSKNTARIQENQIFISHFIFNEVEKKLIS